MDPTPKLALLLKFPESDIRILVTLIASLLFAYPYGVISRKLSPTHQHLLNTITGIAFLYYCYGIGIIHVLFDICLIAVLLNVAGGTIGSVLFTWFWVFGHLLWILTTKTGRWSFRNRMDNRILCVNPKTDRSSYLAL